jgi:hypothetical protein
MYLSVIRTVAYLFVVIVSVTTFAGAGRETPPGIGPLSSFREAHGVIALRIAATHFSKQSKPTIDGTQLFYSDRHGNLIAFDIRRHRNIWIAKADRCVNNTPILAVGKHVLCMTDGNRLAARDEITGRLLWRSISFGLNGITQIKLASDLYLAGGTVARLDWRTGALKWRDDGFTFSHVVSMHHNRLLLSIAEGSPVVTDVTVMDATTGRRLLSVADSLKVRGDVRVLSGGETALMAVTEPTGDIGESRIAVRTLMIDLRTDTLSNVQNVVFSPALSPDQNVPNYIVASTTALAFNLGKNAYFYSLDRHVLLGQLRGIPVWAAGNVIALLDSDGLDAVGRNGLRMRLRRILDFSYNASLGDNMLATSKNVVVASTSQNQLIVADLTKSKVYTFTAPGCPIIEGLAISRAYAAIVCATNSGLASIVVATL